MAPAKRSGEETRAEIQRVALELFTRHGYEATSLREIADQLGINKASLYYYFPGKESILHSLFTQRGDEAEALLSWIEDQPTSPDLLERAVLRWVESFSADKLHGIRFLAANPRLSGDLGGAEGKRIGQGLDQVASKLTALLDAPSPSDALLIRMALLSINFAVEAAAGSETSDEEILAAASAAARTLVGGLCALSGDGTRAP
jgi:Transcriptional regulator